MIELRHVCGNTFEDVAGGREPLFLRCMDGGRIAYMHQSGYGCLPESEVTIVEVPNG